MRISTDPKEPMRPLHLTLCLILLAVLAWSGLAPYDRATWWLEVMPVLIAVPLLALTYRRFPLTDMLYVLIVLHAIVLMVGGAYTYARVPFGFDLQHWLHLQRNPYDRIGHFMQGFVPALVAREILLRGAYVTGRKMLAFVCLCIVMAISAWYELIEWGAAVALGQGADEFLGTQGDPWDTQSDMCMAMIGGTCALLLSPLHDRAVAALQVRRR
jgi:putative membrane protein